MRRIKHIGWLCLALFSLFGCDQDAEPTAATTNADTGKPYQAPAPGYIKSASFTGDDNNTLTDWRLLQHSSNKSYQASVADEVIALTRTGTEPWGKISQRFSKKELIPLVGKRLEFSVEVKGDFTDEYGEPVEPPSIAVKVKGITKGAPAMMGSSTLLYQSEPIFETLGVAPWRRYAVQFDVPAAEQARVVDIELAITMTTGGTLWARGPALVELP